MVGFVNTDDEQLGLEYAAGVHSAASQRRRAAHPEVAAADNGPRLCAGAERASAGLGETGGSREQRKPGVSGHRVHHAPSGEPEPTAPRVRLRACHRLATTPGHEGTVLVSICEGTLTKTRLFQATRPQAPTPSLFRILTTQGPLLQHIQTPTYFALPPSQLNFQPYAQLPSAPVQQKVVGLQQSQITTSLAGQLPVSMGHLQVPVTVAVSQHSGALQVPVSVAGLGGQSIIGLAGLDQANATQANSNTLTVPTTIRVVSVRHLSKKKYSRETSHCHLEDITPW